MTTSLASHRRTSAESIRATDAISGSQTVGRRSPVTDALSFELGQRGLSIRTRGPGKRHMAKAWPHLGSTSRLERIVGAVGDEPSQRPSIDELLEDWEHRWLKSVTEQIYRLHHRRQIHDEFLEMLGAQRNPDASIFSDEFHLMYLESQTLAIRRQADDDPRTLSLRRLIGQLQEHRKRFTRVWYVERWMGDLDTNSTNERDRLYAEFHQGMANDAFDEFTDEPGGHALGGRRLSDDRDKLVAITATVVAFVNENVAHVAAEPAAAPVTYEEFHGAVAHLEAMLKRYYLLINQGALITATPEIQDDWKAPFRRALI